MMDKVIWALSPYGCYIIKSGVELLQGFGLHPPESEGFNCIWKLKVPPKINFFYGKFVIMVSLPKCG